MWPSSVITSIIGRPWRLPVSKSSASWAGVILTAPVPNSGSTTSSAMTGTTRSTNGISTRPTDGARVARVVGMDRDGGVAEDRLGPGRGHGDGLVGQRRARRRRRSGSGRTRACRSSGVAITSRSDTLVRSPGHQLISCSPRYARPSSYSRLNATRTACAEPSSIVKRSRLQSTETPRRRCWSAMMSRVCVDELPHPLEVALAAERVAASHLPSAIIRSSTTWAAIRRVVDPGQPERRVALHPRAADHQVLDGRGQGVARYAARR